MTREEILNNSIWENAKLKVYSEFFKKEVIIWINSVFVALKHLQEVIVTQAIVNNVNDFLNLPESEKQLMKNLLYKHCLECCENISYGFKVKKGETESEANQREFGVYNDDDCFIKANLEEVYIEDDLLDYRNNRYVKLCFYPPWEYDHGIDLILKNGKLLDYSGENDTDLGQFE